MSVFSKTGLLCLLMFTSAFGEDHSPKPATPWDMISYLGYRRIGRINIKDATVEDTVDYICKGYFREGEFDEGIVVPRFVIEYRLGEEMLRRKISIEAKNVSIAQALKLALKDTNITITFETGKVIFAQQQPQK